MRPPPFAADTEFEFQLFFFSLPTLTELMRVCAPPPFAADTELAFQLFNFRRFVDPRFFFENVFEASHAENGYRAAGVCKPEGSGPPLTVLH